ncbi:unnamed protein product [Menidia menidia]|uniref:(Atlantic silverside) hypothetical protein n=1 Tax=Menidia menidia TaxID=238744 RepID=A0A8S4AKB7_9TELE|nr:unnamed protein product [Menidia menidia]
MSSPLPKSGSSTSSGQQRRSAQTVPGPHSHRSQRAHPPPPHHPVGSGDASRAEDCETSLRRPLCQPRHADARSFSDHHRAQRRQPGHLDDGYAEEDARHRTGTRHQRERNEPSRSKHHHHHHHHHHDSSQSEQPLAAHHQRGSRQDRRASPTPPSPKHPDDASFFFEPSERVVSGSTSSLSSDPPAASALHKPSRTSKRLSTASENDSSLHPIVKSVFGQFTMSLR